MPRSRATEAHQRPSGRGQPSLRTSSDPLHQRSRSERLPRLSDGQSPRSTQSDPLHQKKLGTRIADLESQLGQAQQELKSLKSHLGSAEAAQRAAAQSQLDHKKSKKPPKASDDIQQETDVFEVPVKKESGDPKIEQNELKPRSNSSSGSPVAFEEQNELELKNSEINMLKEKLAERDIELEAVRAENESLSKADSTWLLQLDEANRELEKSKADAAEMQEKLEATEKLKLELENEMRRLRVQTEQWRKAAEAAASVLAAEVDMNGRRISERCGSMDKGIEFESTEGYAGSPRQIEEGDDGFVSGKKRGIKMFGELWKKKGSK